MWKHARIGVAATSLLWVTAALTAALEAHAQSGERSDRIEPARAAKATCNGEIYRPRRDGVPVLKEPDRTAEVIYTLILGDRVCKVGERLDFSILSWTEPAALSSTGPAGEESGGRKGSLAYVRSIELFHVESQRPRGIVEGVKSWVRYILSGGVPEAPLDIGSPCEKPDGSCPAKRPAEPR